MDGDEVAFGFPHRFRPEQAPLGGHRNPQHGYPACRCRKIIADGRIHFLRRTTAPASQGLGAESSALSDRAATVRQDALGFLKPRKDS